MTFRFNGPPGTAVVRDVVAGPGAPDPVLAPPVAVDWSAQLAQACAGVGLTSHYQPIVDVSRGIVVGYEALARFVGFDERNPEVWFSTARDLHRSSVLEAAALRSALSARPSLPQNTFLSVNLSPDVLSSTAVWSVLDAEGSLGGLVIELTEQTRIESYVGLEPAIRRLRDSGALIAVDDTGAGYAGLQHLLGIRPDIIKLDRAIIAGIDRDEGKRALVEMLGTFASHLDAWILAEGVETADELHTLAQLGVPLVQGYHLGRPVAGWQTLDQDIALALVSTSDARVGETVRSLIEPITTARSTGSAVGLFVDDRVELVVIVDADGRPTSMLEPTGLLSALAETLRINVRTLITDAARRGLVRDGARRFQPLICTDDAGRVVGMVRYERMVAHLAGKAGAGAEVQHLR